MDSQITNRVAESGLITMDPAVFIPTEEILSFDLAPFLFMGQILREKDFREAINNLDAKTFRGKSVAVFCSADAIIPSWAYMLVGSRLSEEVYQLYFGSSQEMKKHMVIHAINQLDLTPYENQRVVIKGCGDTDISDYVFLHLSSRLTRVVKSLMYGEPCSTVPVYKRNKDIQNR